MILYDEFNKEVFNRLDEGQKLDFMKADFMWYRGRIIDTIIELEMFIDIIISNYFCVGDKIADFTACILNTEYITLGGKENILLSILKKQEFSEFYSKNKDLIQNIGKHRKLRNKLAHSKLLSNDDSVNNYDGDKMYLMISTNGVTEDKLSKMSELKLETDKVYKTIRSLIEFIHAYFPNQL